MIYSEILFYLLLNLLSWLVEIWKWIWAVLGPLLLLYLTKPEIFEKILIHVSFVLSYVSKTYEKKAVSREVRYLILENFVKNLIYLKFLKYQLNGVMRKKLYETCVGVS